MLAAWRGSAMAARPKHRPALYDDERSRVRSSGRTLPQAAPGQIGRTGTDGYKR
jgi:hypothetical protein